MEHEILTFNELSMVVTVGTSVGTTVGTTVGTAVDTADAETTTPNKSQ